MEEHFFQCPHCWESISMLLDPSVSSQKYIEDCEICCNPMEVSVSFQHNEMQALNIQKLDQ